MAATAVRTGDGDGEAGGNPGWNSESRGWVDRLRSPATERDAALARLHTSWRM